VLATSIYLICRGTFGSALDELPIEFQRALEHVPIVVSDRGAESHAYGMFIGVEVGCMPFFGGGGGTSMDAYSPPRQLHRVVKAVVFRSSAPAPPSRPQQALARAEPGPRIMAKAIAQAGRPCVGRYSAIHRGAESR
jgi:hypothetical protein